MPQPLQWAGYLFPLTYFIPIVRGVMSKGIGIEYLQGQVIPLVIYIVIILFFAGRAFRQNLD